MFYYLLSCKIKLSSGEVFNKETLISSEQLADIMKEFSMLRVTVLSVPK